MSVAFEEQKTSSQSSVTADNDPDQPVGRGKMEAAPSHFATIFRSLVEDFQDQLNEIKQGHTALLKELDEVKYQQQQLQTALEELPSWREATDEKLQDAQIKAEAAVEASNGVHDVLRDIRAERQSLREAVDSILEQPNALTAKVQGLRQAQNATPAAPAQSKEAEDSIVVARPANTEPIRRPKAIAHGLRRRQELDPELSLQVSRPSSANSDLARDIAQDGKVPQLHDQIVRVDYDALVHRGLQASLMPPPPSRQEREHSVVFTSTFCGDESPVSTASKLRPPPRAARPELPVARIPQTKRKRLGQGNIALGEDGSPKSLEQGTKRSRRTTPSSAAKAAPVGNDATIQSVTTTAQAIDTTDRGEDTQVPQMQASAARPAEEGVEALTTYVADQQGSDDDDDDDDEIVVAPRSRALSAADTDTADGTAQADELVSQDFGAVGIELLGAIGVENVSEEQAVPAPGPTSVALQGTRSKLVNVSVPSPSASTSASPDPPALSQYRPSPPPKTSQKTTLSEVQRQWGLRPQSKDTAASPGAQEGKDAITFSTVRRSGRAPKPTKMSGE